jgi:hypothetical protein
LSVSLLACLSGKKPARPAHLIPRASTGPAPASFQMDVHFVHKHVETGALGVLGVFLVPGAPNTTFASLAAAFSAKGR